MSDTVLLDIKDGIALVTLNRPKKLNALDYELIDRLMALLDKIEVTPEVRAVILTGAGDRAFSPARTSMNFPRACAAGPTRRSGILSDADKR